MEMSDKEEEIIESYEIDEEELDDDYYDEDEEYQEFTDVGVLETNSRKERISNIILIIITIIILLAVVDIIRIISFDKKPFFAIPTTTYKDGGTKEYYGLGYKVIDYHQIQGRRDTEIGLWSLQYNTTAITIKDKDLAQAIIVDNKYHKYHKKFVRISSYLQENNVEKRELLLREKKATTPLNIICEVVSDQAILDNYIVGKNITILGTIKKYDKTNGTIIVENCFAEQ